MVRLANPDFLPDIKLSSRIIFIVSHDFVFRFEVWVASHHHEQQKSVQTLDTGDKFLLFVLELLIHISFDPNWSKLTFNGNNSTSSFPIIRSNVFYVIAIPLLTYSFFSLRFWWAGMLTMAPASLLRLSNKKANQLLLYWLYTIIQWRIILGLKGSSLGACQTSYLSVIVGVFFDFWSNEFLDSS